MVGPAIGIDLGTTLSCVGVFKNGAVKIISNEHGDRTTPSYVAFEGTEVLIGESAKTQAAMNAENTIFDAKRLIGRRYGDETVQDDVKRLPFKVMADKKGNPSIEVTSSGKKTAFCPEEISAKILSKMKELAENHLESEVTDAVVTVPAYFTDAQRQATKDAGAIAGLNVLKIINEPSAAALAYKFDVLTGGKKNVLIYDLGGGTFDVSVLTMEKDHQESITRSTAGDTHLGGEDFDNILIDHFIKEFNSKHKKDISKNKRALTRLRREVEKAKIFLSESRTASIVIDSLHDNIDFSTAIDRAKFEQLCDPLFKQTLRHVDRAVEDSGLSKEEIDEVILVGGSTRIPKLQEMLSDCMKGKKLNKSVNPAEAVAFGAALQAANLRDTEGELQGLILIDVLPLSLGVKQNDGTIATLIKRNTRIPHSKRKMFTTETDDQTTVKVQVYEGEAKCAKDNNLLDTFSLSGIPKMKAGKAKIYVTFEVDGDGILNATAVEESTGNRAQVTITTQGIRLSQEEIDKLVRKARQSVAD